MCSMLFIVCLCTLLLRAHAIGGRAVLLSDLAPGNASSDPQFMTQLTPTVLLFTATAPGVGRELFMYNATSRTVTLVKDIFPGEAGSDPADLCLFPLTGDIVFAATTAQGRALWRTDGTSNGTLAIAGVPEPAHMFYSTSQRMLYLASVNRGYAWAIYLKADYQPHLVIAGGEQNYFPNYFCDGEAGDVYFAASTQATGREIWRVQPVAGEDSAAATLLLGAHDFGIAAGPLSGDPAYLTRCDTPANTVLFSGNRQEGRGDEPLWIASGVAFFDTTQAPLDLADSHPSDIFAVPGHTCVFTATDSTGVREPYQFRDMQIGCKKLTAAPTSVAHPLGTEPRHFSWWRSRLYFSGNVDDGARDMFSLPLDSLPQTPVHALSGARIRDPTGMTVFQDSILFAASTPDAGTELYQYFACDGVAVDPLAEECDGGTGCLPNCTCDTPTYRPATPRDRSCVLSPIVQTNPCDSSPCAKGASCVTDATSSAFECVCPAGWSGLLCDTAVVVPAACESAPCYNGATCESTDNGTYVCSCAAGYEGTRCEQEVDECASRPCANGGTCVDMINGYLCTCAEGFAGLDCATNIDDCVLHPCENGGSCVDGVGSFVCHCVQGFTGNRCSLPVPAACDSRPCMHGGNCSGTVDTFLCACPAGWNGTRCEKERSQPLPVPVIEQVADSLPAWQSVAVGIGATGGTLAVAFAIFSYMRKVKIVPAFTPVSPDAPAVEIEQTRVIMDM